MGIGRIANQGDVGRCVECGAKQAGCKARLESRVCLTRLVYD